MVPLLLIVVAVLFALQALHTRALLSSALWLAGVSALTAMLLYQYGAHFLAVIELSVGTGLVTVLFVLAINIAGDEPLPECAVLPKGLALGMLVLLIAIIGWMVLSADLSNAGLMVAADRLSQVHWQDRGLDVLVQVILIFSGVLGFLGLLAEVQAPLAGSLAAAVARRRDQDMQELEERVRLPEDGQS